VRCIFALALRPGDLIGRSVLLALQAFDLGNQPPSLQLGGGQLLQVGGDIETAVRHGLLDSVEIVANVIGIKHGL
jgi:hypothetical protein